MRSQPLDSPFGAKTVADPSLGGWLFVMVEEPGRGAGKSQMRLAGHVGKQVKVDRGKKMRLAYFSSHIARRTTAHRGKREVMPRDQGHDARIKWAESAANVKCQGISVITIGE